jgi:hypothetical protein
MEKYTTQPHGTTMIGIDENLVKAKIHTQESGDLLIITQNSYGYGDIIRLMAYAKELMSLYSKKVHVKFVVISDYNAFSFEQIVYDVLDHYELTTTYDVEVCRLEKYAHKYTNLLKKEYAQEVYDWLGCPRLNTRDEPLSEDYICVWTPWDNLHRVSKDKMPINKDAFNNFLDALDITVKPVSYRVSVEETFDLIRLSKLCIGYEGIGQQIAYHYDKPLISLSNLTQVSKNTGGPESKITNNLEDVRSWLNVY